MDTSKATKKCGPDGVQLLVQHWNGVGTRGTAHSGNPLSVALKPSVGMNKARAKRLTDFLKESEIRMDQATEDGKRLSSLGDTLVIISILREITEHIAKESDARKDLGSG
jgi:hypothetical protein